jgi:hypothetical protein
VLKRDLTTLLALAPPENRDMMTSPEGPHACLSPRMTLARAMSLAIEQSCNAAVRQKPSQFREQLFDFDVCRPAMPAGTVFYDAQRSVVAALPMHHQFEVCVRDANHNLLDHSSQDSFA